MNYIKTITIEPGAPVAEYTLCDFRDDTKKIRKCKFINDFNSVFNMIIDDINCQGVLKDDIEFEFPAGIQSFKISPVESSSSYIHLLFIVEEWGN